MEEVTKFYKGYDLTSSEFENLDIKIKNKLYDEMIEQGLNPPLEWYDDAFDEEIAEHRKRARIEEENSKKEAEEKNKQSEK